MEQFKQLLQNKTILMGIIVTVILAIIFITILGSINANKSKGEPDPADNIKIQDDVELLTTDNLGKALEIQALLTKHGINATRSANGTKSSLILSKKGCSISNKNSCTIKDRDIAIMVIVESGLYDQNVGLEIFDKGDFTSTKEDKKIRLVRAMNGELARLIKRIDGIQDASVFISIPEQSMFAVDKKPVTATVQLTVAVGQMLSQSTIKAVTNLVLGAVGKDLTADHISISDTNGHVYNSVIDASSEMLEKLQENDKYMQEKVQAQLNKLIGGGKYVVTVSTFLKQAPVEKFTIAYDPNSKTAISEQTFSEGLGDKTSDSNSNVNAVSVYLPNGLPSGNSNSSQNRSYQRSAKETEYGVTKTQINEYMTPGAIEEISIAVTLEKDSLPVELTTEDLKELVARAASPKAKAENVTVAFADTIDPLIASDKTVKAPIKPSHGNPWWLAIALMFFGLLFGHRLLTNRIKHAKEMQDEELERLKEQNEMQEKQLKDLSVNAANLIQKQTQLQQGLIEQQNRPNVVPTSAAEIREALRDLKREIDGVDDIDAGDRIKSWIEG